MAKLKFARKIGYMERVRVYRNLHTGLLSVQSMKGRIIAHVGQIVLQDAKFSVRPSGRAKVLREKKKNVHAFVTGKCFFYYDDIMALPKAEDYVFVTYNPYKYDSFVEVESQEPVREAAGVVITKDGKIRALTIRGKIYNKTRSQISVKS